MLNELKLNKLVKQDLDVLREFEMKMFCRDCQNTINELHIAHNNMEAAFHLAKSEAKGWEKTYMDLTEVVQESHAVLEILRVENQLNAQIIGEWEQRQREEAARH